MEGENGDVFNEIWFKFLMDLTPDATIICDSQGIIRVVNDQSVALFGYSRDELLGSPIEILVPEEKRHAHVGFRNNFLSDSEVRNMRESVELTTRTKSGELIPVSVGLSPLSTMGHGNFVLASVKNNTVLNNALKNQAESLKQAELFNKMAVSRELKMVELKEEVNELLNQLGKEPRYKV